MKVAHFAPMLDPFGSAHLIHCLLRYRGSGFAQQWVVTASDDAVAAGLRQTGFRVFVETEAARCVDRLASADLINAHCPFPGPGPAMLWVLAHTVRPYVFTLHGPAHPQRPLPAVSICTSALIQRVQWPCSACELIDGGVDLALFSPWTNRRTARRCVITRIGHPARCSEYFWFALAEVASRHPEVDLRIVGASCRAAGRVQAVGAESDLPTALAHTDIMVSAPVSEEANEALMVMAGMAMGAPTVLADIPSYRDCAVDGETSLLVPPGDTTSLVSAIERLIQDEPLRQRLGVAAIEHARQHFDARERVAVYEQIYSRVVAESRMAVSSGAWAKGMGLLRDAWLHAWRLQNKKPEKGAR